MQTTYVPDLKALPYQKPENSSFKQFFNPFAPEPPVTAGADPGPFYPL